MLLFEPDLHSIAFVKLPLLCFELMSGLKINFLQCEVLTMGLNELESQRVVDLLNCRLIKFSFKYLGLPISNKHIMIYRVGTTLFYGREGVLIEGKIHVIRC